MNVETAATETIMLPLNKLKRDPLNVRKTYSKEGIEELASTIRADNYRLLQNMVVRSAEKKGHYYVAAGGRRLAALKLLAEAGEIAKDFPVECKVRDGNDATEISLTENVAREQMHPADEFEAFKALAETGKPIADIAARFGVTELVVKRRLALANVSPVLLQKYREDEMSLEILMAFTVSADHARQEQVWEQANSQYAVRAQYIRRLLMAEALSVTSTLMKAVGLDAYIAAGGHVNRDLFDDANSGYATDIDLLNRLASEKLQAIADEVMAEGWKWVETFEEFPSEFHSFRRIYPQTVPVTLTEEQQSELDRLTEEYDALSSIIENEGGEEAEERLAAIDARLSEIQTITEAYDAEKVSIAGAIVYIHHDGEIKVTRGLIRPEDDRNEKSTETDRLSAISSDNEESFKLSAVLVQELTAHKTAAARVQLAHAPSVALAAVVHALLLQTFYRGDSSYSSLQIRIDSERLETSIKNPDESAALQEMDRLHEAYAHQLPGNPKDLWAWCMDCDQPKLLDLLAFVAGRSLNAVQLPHYSRERERHHLDQMAAPIGLFMQNWFTPNAENYFGRISKAGIEHALSEAISPDFAKGIAQMKKGEAAAYAAEHIAGTGWLPEALRGPVDQEQTESDDLPEEFPAAAE